MNLVPRKEGVKVVGNKWVYKVKRNFDGSIARYKARLVANGFAKSYGVDYEATFSPIAKMTTIRAIIGLANVRNLASKLKCVNHCFAASLNLFLLENTGSFETGNMSHFKNCP